MALTPGTRLGPYEITGPLGAGGMGEVYRAKDTRLGRDVAVKILPAHLWENAEVRERFEREARAISSLNHPHICTLYDIGREGSADYFVMELLEGETLASRLERGPLKVDEALKIAAQIADALAAAHRQRIVHRDLKPGNIVLTRSGAKVLDFGVAKLRDDVAVDNLTRTTPLTSQGAIVGTVQYMSPEQLEGAPVDERADLFAFGAVLYEMLTGKRAFEGTSQASVIAAILKEEPRPVSHLVPTTPASLDRVVTSCLVKNPDERWQSAGDLARELRWIAGGTGVGGTGAATTAHAAATPSRRRLPSWAIGVVGVGVILGAVGMAAVGWTLHRPVPAPLLRASLVLPQETALDSDNASIALSPDGTRLVYAASVGTGTIHLWVRPLTSLAAQPLAGTEGASYPFWSPDGSNLGFFADGKLKRIRASGGAVQSICPAPQGRGAAWGAGDVIVFAPDTTTPLDQVSASGGSPTEVTKVSDADTSHRNPHFLPDGRRVLFFSGRTAPGPEDGIYCLDLATKATQLVMHAGSEGIYVEPGYLVFVREGNLMAQRFDASSLKVSGEAVPVAEKVQFNGFRRTGTYTFSRSGTLIYLSDTILQETQLTYYDLDGKVLGTVGEPAMFWLDLRISPDQRRAVTTVRRAGEGSDPWVYDLDRGVGSRITSDQAGGLCPIWSHDGRQVAYADASNNVWIKAADGASAPRKITSDPIYTLYTPQPVDWMPDGAGIATFTRTPKTGMDVVIVPVNGEGKPRPLLVSPADEADVRFSPDGHWMGYSSEESGRTEFYITSYPGRGSKWQISTGGGVRGAWLGDGKEVWYRDLDGKYFAVPVTVAGDGLEVGKPRPLFGGQILPVDVANFTPDGKRLLGAARRPSTTGPVLTLVTQWASELAPAGR